MCVCMCLMLYDGKNEGDEDGCLLFFCFVFWGRQVLYCVCSSFPCYCITYCTICLYHTHTLTDTNVMKSPFNSAVAFSWKRGTCALPIQHKTKDENITSIASYNLHLTRTSEAKYNRHRYIFRNSIYKDCPDSRRLGTLTKKNKFKIDTDDADRKMDHENIVFSAMRASRVLYDLR